MKLWVIALVIFCSMLGGLAQIYLKKGSDGFVFAYEHLIRNYSLMFGFALYGISFALYIFALRFERVTILYPIISFSYIFVMLFAWAILGEKIIIRQWAGALCIILGVSLIAK